ncbi:MAG: S9 family peptidase, partial [Dokdonella sp.]
MLTLRSLVAPVLFLFTASAIAAPVPLADFSRHLKFGDVQISPDGKTLAAVSNLDGQRSLSLINLADNKAINIRPRENAQVIKVWWV